ncbi:MAG: hypothetical protein EOQ41_27360 [Mesorhizobium sp.]|uniref:hypothetical protein n=1 Tax=Mesorhizobium sp. TaxID=1871066 RepID=UPI000FE71AC3|nr:hypothetical protein [Mesorhizobium sp.]RWB24409.1 MAG: hypothetical protein EOQ41_27360 [Mesorhizobium sp.]
MTVASETNRSGPYNGNGVTTVFDYEFRIIKETHLKVIKTVTATGVETTLTLGANYTVSGVGAAGGGQITALVAPVAGETITILRKVRFVQETDLENQGAYYAETVETMLDLAAMRDQELQEQLSRAVLLPPAENPDQLDGLVFDILRLAQSADNIDTVADNIGDVTTAADNMAAIIAAPGAATSAAASAVQASASAGQAAGSEVAAELAEQNAEEAAAIALEASENAVLQTIVTYTTVDFCKLANIPSVLTHIQVAGYSVVGVGRGFYKKVFTGAGADPGKFQSGDGALWELIVDFATTIDCYGANPDNTNATNGTDSTAGWQRMIDHVGYYRLGAGRYRITDSIHLYNSAGNPNSIGVHCHGAGKEKSIVVAHGMAGKACLVPAVNTGLHRFHLSHHQFAGDADSSVDYTLASGQLYESSFRQMSFKGVAKASFIANIHFACKWDGCSFTSTSGDSVLLQGGNSTVLENCYAHNHGVDKAGFRIGGVATLIGCLGVDETVNPGYVFEFGGDPFATGTNAVIQIHIQGGNAEDFGTAAIGIHGINGGQIIIENLASVSRAAGTYETVFKMIDGTAASVWIRGNTRHTTKGATRSGNSNLQGTGGSWLVENSSNTTTGSFPDFYNTTSGLLTEIPILQVRGGDLGKQDLQISRVKSGRESGYVAATPTNLPANTVAPVVARTNVVKTANTLATSLRSVTFTEGNIDGQRLQILIGDSNTTLVNQFGGAQRFHLLDNADRLCVNGEVYDFILAGGFWIQQNPSRKLRASAVIDPASMLLVGDATVPATIAVAGAAFGDLVRASFGASLAGASLHAYVSGPGTVDYFFRNDAGAAPNDLPSATLRVEITKA